MRGICLTTVVMGCVLGLASGASAQVTPVVAGDSITAAGINAIIDAVNGVGAFQGNLELPATTPLTGQFRVNGTRFLHSFGTNNTFLGRNAGNFTLTGSNNTAVGDGALRFNTEGSENTAVGIALLFNTIGSNNTAVGSTALLFNTIGSNNTAVGHDALESNTEGNQNTAVGEDALVFNTIGSNNTAVGHDALESNTEGNQNTAVGEDALVFNTIGSNNTAVGEDALRANTEGGFNTAVGDGALRFNTEGNHNTAVGEGGLLFNTTGSHNTAVGLDALRNTTGDDNTAVGEAAGSLATTGDNNIYLGANVFGVAAEANTMYLGRVGTQTTTFIAGVRGITTGADAIQVLIASSGQLGTVSSSRRYKEDIQDMGRASAGLLDLRPVTFRYTQASTDGATPIQYGLIAEEVAAIYPDVVVYNDAGQPETVQYRKVNAMLLNEVQRQHRQIEAQQEQLEALRTRLAAVERRLDTKGVPRLKPANAS